MSADELIAGRYRRRRSLGQGGMGQVWLVDDTLLGRSVAIKTLRTDPFNVTDPSMVERMMREARLAARLRHPNIVAVHDLLMIDGQPTVVMEYVEGESLADRLDREQTLSIGEAARIIRDVASALHAAHRAGVLHRDIKPANVLLDVEGAVKLADFGIARGGDDAALTQTGQIIGTIAYMAPEIALGRPALPASDVWSLGATLYACLEGRGPHQESGPTGAVALLAHLMTQPHIPPRRAGAVTGLLERMLAPDPSLRPSAGQVSSGLGPYAAPDPAHAETARTPTELPATDAPSAASPVDETPSSQAETASDERWPSAPSLSPTPTPAPSQAVTVHRSASTTNSEARGDAVAGFGDGPPPPVRIERRPTPSPGRMPHRRAFLVAAIAALVAVAGTVAALIATSGGSDPRTHGSSTPAALGRSGSGAGSGPASSRGAAVPGVAAGRVLKIGFLGPLSGDNAQFGINLRQGAELAVAQANSSGRYDFTVQLHLLDTAGESAGARAAATALVADTDVMAAIGPSLSSESKAVNASICGGARPMAIVTASATDPTLQSRGWTCWHRVVADDDVEATQTAEWLARTGSRSVFVLDDSGPYGDGLAASVTASLRSAGVKVSTGRVDPTDSTSFRAAARQVVASGADAVYFGGYDTETATLAGALRSAGFRGRAVTGDASLDSLFSPTGAGWYVACGCVDALQLPSARAFVAAYRAKYSEDPGLHTAEAYDATNAVIAALAAAERSGAVDRASVLRAFNQSNYRGITTTIRFQADGDLVSADQLVTLYRVSGGKFVSLGDIRRAA